MPTLEELTKISKAVAEARLAAVRAEIKAQHTTKRIKGARS